MKTAGKKVLIVEDDKWFRDYLVKVISEAGYEVRAVKSSYDAIEDIDDSMPDVIFLDLLLPGANGIALLNELQTYSDTRVIPIVLCSSVVETVPHESLEKYHIKRTLDKTTMEPADILASLKSVL